MALTRINDDYTGYFDGKEKERITMPDGTIEIKYDRAKNARFQADYSLGINTSGISKRIPNCFEIVPGSGLTVIRSPGKGWLDGHFANLMYQQAITLAENNQVYYYIIRCMSDAENRCMYEGVLMEPTAGSIPVRTENTFDLVLARIEIPAGVTQVTKEMISSLRSSKEWCGYAVSEFNPDEIIVTADDVTDTDTHLIPVKTESREQLLRGDGTYSDDLTDNAIGNYKFIYDNFTDAMQIVYKKAAQVNFNKTPISYQLISSGDSGNLENMLSGVDNSSYGFVTAENGNPAIIAFKYYDVLPSFEIATNIDITISIKHSATSTLPTTLYCELYDLDTNTVISGTQNALIRSIAIKTESFNFHFDSMNAKKIGLYIYGIRSGSGVVPIRIYGSELKITYDVPYKTLLKIDPNKVTAYNYANGSAEVMGAQAIPETPSEATAFTEGVEEPETMTFTEPDEIIPPHGTSPETALPYVKSVYMSGEYMIENGEIYKCLEDNTVHPPSVQAVAHKWELVATDGV